MLLRAGANAQLAHSSPSDNACFPLDVAAEYGHWEVAHELMQERGIEGCGGEIDGCGALYWAAMHQHLKVLKVLARGGVVDKGAALYLAAKHGRESSVKFLLLQRKRSGNGEGAAYVNICHPSGATVLVRSIQACSPRVTRLLVDAGADTTTPVRLLSEEGFVVFVGTSLAYTNSIIRNKEIEGEEASESQLHSVYTAWRLPSGC